ncbi:MAG: energy transducer TonB [Desulfobacterales bacterium]|nr:energy transducer TonB [Desulfobacterales bacterium]
MRRMLIAAAFALTFHGWLLSSQCAWLLPEASTAALRRTVRISLTPAPATAPAPVKSALKEAAKEPPAKSSNLDTAEKPTPPAEKKNAPAPKPAPAVQEKPVEAPLPEPKAETDSVVEAPPPPAQFSSLFDSVKSSSSEPLIPEGIAALSKKAETARNAEETVSQARSANDDGPALIEARPLYRRNPPPDYPRLARRRGYQGTVVLDVLVDKTGRVKEVKVEESSGHGSLDRAAKQAVKRWRFTPGRRGDDPMDMWVKVPVRFELR